MRLVWWLPWLAIAPVAAAEVYTKIAPPLDQRLQNSALEERDGGALAGWTPFESGYEVVPYAGRDGTQGAQCVRTGHEGPAAGLSQTIRLDQTRPTPLLVSAWSRAAGVTGVADSNYSLYCDLIYTDGTPLWGQSEPFAPGSHDWARAEVWIAPAKPVRSITIYGLFRGSHAGTVWFDDFSLAELGGADLVMLDGVAVEPTPPAAPTGAVSRWQAGSLEVALAGTQVTDVRLGDQSVMRPGSVGGFLVRDVAADGGFHSFENGQAVGVTLAASTTAAGEALRVSAEVADTTGQDRALTVLFALPLELAGWHWGQDADEALEVERGGQYGNTSSIEAGSIGQLSRYPLANVAGPAGALNLALNPRHPALYRLGCSGATGLLYIAFDIALPSALQGQPARATLAFDLFTSDPAWGFRAGLERFYALHPDLYQVRIPDQGTWQAFAPISQVEGWEDFGFRFKEGTDETAWDDAHDILTFRYSEMGTYWMAMPPEMPRTYENAVKLLEERAADPKANGLAAATLASGMRDRDGRYLVIFRNTPWCDGAVFSLNPSPTVEGFSQAEYAWGERARATYARTDAVLDGEYLDSLEGYVTAALNFRPEHLLRARLPLTYTRDDRQPVLHKAFSIGEFVIQVADDLHGMGKLLMANSTPYRYGFMSVWFDVLGTETNWMPGGSYRATADSQMALWRAWSGQKPYLLLQNTNFEPFGPYVERYFARALAYGMYPSMFSHNASEGHYFRNPDLYNRDRALFREYIPRIRQVAEAGWQPVTGARCDNPALHLERFGPGRDQTSYLTVHNPTEEPQSGQITLPDGLALRRVELAAYATEVLTLP